MDWKSKLTSRKFWAAIGNFVAMLVVALGGTQEASTQVVALIMAGAGVIAYIIGEGMADAAGAGTMWVQEDEMNTGVEMVREREREEPPEVGENG